MPERNCACAARAPESNAGGIPIDYLKVLTTADLEIQASARYLRLYIDASRSEIIDVARGVLLRIAELSEIMTECAGGYDEDEQQTVESLRERLGLEGGEA